MFSPWICLGVFIRSTLSVVRGSFQERSFSPGDRPSRAHPVKFGAGILLYLNVERGGAKMTEGGFSNQFLIPNSLAPGNSSEAYKFIIGHFRSSALRSISKQINELQITGLFMVSGNSDPIGTDISCCPFPGFKSGLLRGWTDLCFDPMEGCPDESPLWKLARRSSIATLIQADIDL